MMTELMTDLTLDNIEAVRRNLMYIDMSSKEYGIIIDRLDYVYNVIKKPYFPKVNGIYIRCGKCEEELNNIIKKIPQSKFCPYCGNKFKEESGELCK